MSRFTSQPSLLKLPRLLTLVSVCTIAGGISLTERSLPAQPHRVAQSRQLIAKCKPPITFSEKWIL